MDSLESHAERNLQTQQRWQGMGVGLSKPPWEVIIIEKFDALMSQDTATIKVRAFTAHQLCK